MEAKSRTPDENKRSLMEAATLLLEKSKENWSAFEQLRGDDKLDAAANRLYYSIFQAVKAYAVVTGKTKIDETNSVHNMMKRIVSAEGGDARTFSDAMEMRKTADYMPQSITMLELDQDFRFKADALRQSFAKMAGKQGVRQ